MDTYYAKDRQEWRAWLHEHHAHAKEIWLVYYRKATGKPRVAYNDAVEEALCFGWIDSQQKGIDEERFAQRFSPRKPSSNWSESNKARLRNLIAQGKMTPAGLEAAQGVDLDEPFVIAPDIESALRADPQTWQHFQDFPEDYQSIRVAFIESARNRPAEFKKRLDFFLKKTAQNKTFKYG
ncbi:MAG: YdeI/OmpD-associated family protein [Chloroflexi bacterium]|nr:YdeI/OmpD-associated family protein [Chloroflexota bacterium]